MEVTRGAAIEMFRQIGYKLMDKWDDEQMTRKLNNLPNIVEKTDDIPQEIQDDPNHLCNVICKAVMENKEKIVLQQGDAKMAKKEKKGLEEAVKERKPKKDPKRGRILSVAEYEGREEPKKVRKGEFKDKKREKPAREKAEKTETAEKKVGAGRNKYGYRIGTKSDAIDSCLGKKPLTVSEIAGKSKVDPQTVRMHLKHAIDNDRGVKLTEEGYVSTI